MASTSTTTVGSTPSTTADSGRDAFEYVALHMLHRGEVEPSSAAHGYLLFPRSPTNDPRTRALIKEVLSLGDWRGFQEVFAQP